MRIPPNRFWVRDDDKNPEDFENLLGKLINVNSDVIGAAIFTTSGLIIASAFSRSVKWSLISSMTAQIQSNAKKTAKELSLGQLERTLIVCEEGAMMAIKVGKDLILCVITKPNARLGMLLLGLQTLVRDLSSKDHKPNEVEKVILKIFSIMEEKETNTLTFEKKYLPELFNNQHLQFDTEDGLPIVNLNASVQFTIQGLHIKYDEDLVVFARYY